MWLVLIRGWDIKEESVLRNELDELQTLPWIGMKTAQDQFVPWLASQTDILADDWSVVE